MTSSYPRAEKARDILPRTLQAQGARVTVATAYRTVNSGRKKEELAGGFPQATWT